MRDSRFALHAFLAELKRHRVFRLPSGRLLVGSETPASTRVYSFDAETGQLTLQSTAPSWNGFRAVRAVDAKHVVLPRHPGIPIVAVDPTTGALSKVVDIDPTRTSGAGFARVAADGKIAVSYTTRSPQFVGGPPVTVGVYTLGD